MSDPSISIDFDDIEKAITALGGPTFKSLTGKYAATALKTAGQKVQKRARAEASKHRRTGKMRGHIRSRATGRGLDTEVKVTTGGSVAALVVMGARPHTIEPGAIMPISSGTGAFRGGLGSGITGFATRVQHPGFAGDPFFGRAIAHSESDIKHLIDTAADAMVTELAAKMRGRS